MDAPLRRPSRPTFAALAVGALVLFVAHLLTGTDFDYAVLTGIYYLATAAAFVLFGGTHGPVGWLVIALAVKGPLGAHLVKLATMAPADKGLDAPLPTIGIYCAGMSIIALIALLRSLLPAGVPLLRPVLKEARLQRLVLLTLAFSWFIQVSTYLPLPEAVRLAMTYFTFLPSVAVAASTARCLQRSDGRKAMDLQTAAICGYMALSAIAYGSKQGLFETFLANLITLHVMGFRFRPRHFILVGSGLALFNTVLYPIMLTRAQFQGDGIVDRLQSAAVIGQQLSDNRLEAVTDYEALQNMLAQMDIGSAAYYTYFGFDTASMQRVNLYPMAGRLVAMLGTHKKLELEALTESLTILPRSVTGYQARKNPNNVLGHFAEVLHPLDDTTGISFGPFAENYAFMSPLEFVSYTFTTVAVFVFAVMLALPRLSGNVWSAPLVLSFLHNASETSTMSCLFWTLRILPIFALYYFAFFRVDRALAERVGKNHLVESTR